MTDEDLNEQELDRFEARFFGTLQEDDAAAFDADLERDASMRDRYTLFGLSVRGIRSVSSSVGPPQAGDLRKRFRSIDRELEAEAPLRTLFRPWMGWAAVVLVLLGGAGLWWSGGPDSPQELALEFTVPEPGLPVLMGASPRAMDAIMNAYKQDDMSVASALLDAALLADGANDTLNYFRAVVYERAGDEQAARTSYGKVPVESVFHVRALYRSALLLLRSDDITGARSALDPVAASDDQLLAAKARDLLDHLGAQ